MRKGKILLAGLILAGLPAIAQNHDPNVSPIYPGYDPNLIYMQGFSTDYEQWTPFDAIRQIEYYDHEGSGVIYQEPTEDRGLFRDTVILLKNMVEITNSITEIENNYYPDDAFTVIFDGGNDPERSSVFAQYGEDGGDISYFSYVTGQHQNTNSWMASGYAESYRRYLSLPGLDIQDETSYRLTFFVKANKRNQDAPTPRMYVGLMRGAYNCEKPFSMGYVNDPNNYSYYAPFELVKEDFTGEWEKVSFMAYYLNDSIANKYFYTNGYYWGEGDWTWSAQNNNLGKDLNYIVQPDKYFARLSFSSDDTEFLIDNVSLTKSWIAGADYYGDKLRIDFGYKTNIIDLCNAQKEATGIDIVDVPFDPETYNFEVWGLNGRTQRWEEIYIRSVEYHKDGYMYMFTDYDIIGGQEVFYNFNNYEQVLVSFKNPTDQNLQLRYTGKGTTSSEVFPKALDVEWIKAGKVIPDLVNELATPVPASVLQDVHSLSDVPPVMQEAQIEENSFGLDGSIRQFKFYFSREMEIDNPDNIQTRQRCVVYVNDYEIWDRVWSDADNSLTITRPEKYTSPLDGDCEIEILNIYVPGTTIGGNDVVVHYNFGTISRNTESYDGFEQVWDARFYDTTVNTGSSQLQPAGTAASYYYAPWGSGGSVKFEIGNGVQMNNAARLYFYTSQETDYPCLLSLSPRGNSSHTASLYLGYGDDFEINLNSGSYCVQFDAASLNKPRWIKAYVYPWNEAPHELNINDKVLIGEYTFDSSFPEELRNNSENCLDTLLEPIIFGFNIGNAGRYIVEIEVQEGGGQPYPGVLMSNPTISITPISYIPIKTLNDAVYAAQEQAAAASVSLEKYSGNTFTHLNSMISLYRDGGPFTSTKPSDWYAASKDLRNTIADMKQRMNTVDQVEDKKAEVAQKLTEVLSDDNSWSGLAAYETLAATKATADSYPYPNKNNEELTDFIYQMDYEMYALDERIYNNKLFIDAIESAYNLLNQYERSLFPDEYNTLWNAYLEATDFDVINATNQQLEMQHSQLNKATNTFILTYDGTEAKTARLKSLAALSKDLGIVFPDDTDIYQMVSDAKADDDNLADILKAAIKVAIYEKICNGQDIGDIDLTPFIKNYNLYATAIIDNPDVDIPKDDASFLTNAIPSTPESNVFRIEHRYNTSKFWVMFLNTDIDNLYPGWTVRSFNTGGNKYVTPDHWNDGFPNYDKNKSIAVFDGTLSMDWNSKAELLTVIDDLPAGTYDIGVEIRSVFRYENRQNGRQSTLIISNENYSTSTYFTPTYLDTATYVVIDGETVSVPSDYLNDTTTVQYVRDFDIGQDGTMWIDLSLVSGSGQVSADNFSLRFRKDNYYDYSNLLSDARTELSQLLDGLSIVIVDPEEPNPNNPLAPYIQALEKALTDAQKMLNDYNGYNYSGNIYQHLDYLVDYFGEVYTSEPHNTQFWLELMADSIYEFMDLLSKRIEYVDGYLTEVNTAAYLIDNYAIYYSALAEYQTLQQTYRSVTVNKCPDLTLDDLDDYTTRLNNSIKAFTKAIEPGNQDPPIVEGNQIYMTNVSCEAGSELVIPIQMTSTESITAFSVDVQLPQGFSFVSAALDSQRSNGHELSVNVNGRVVSLASMSFSNKTFIGIDGTVVNITVSVPQDAEGQYSVLLNNMEMTVSPTKMYNPASYSGTIAVTAFVEPGDVNTDGKITITDAVGVVAFIINSNTEGLNRRAADADRNGEINVTDAVYVLNKVIRKNVSHAPTRNATQQEITSTLAADNVGASALMTLPLRLDGMSNEITAIQFDIKVPDNIDLKGITTDNNHMVISNRQDDGSYIVVCLSLNNSTFNGGGESALTLELASDKSFIGGLATIDNIRMATPNCQQKSQETVVVKLGYDEDQTGILMIESDSESEMYDLQGRTINRANGIFIRNGKKQVQLK